MTAADLKAGMTFSLLPDATDVHEALIVETIAHPRWRAEIDAGYSTEGDIFIKTIGGIRFGIQPTTPIYGAHQNQQTPPPSDTIAREDPPKQPIDQIKIFTSNQDDGWPELERRINSWLKETNAHITSISQSGRDHWDLIVTIAYNQP